MAGLPRGYDSWRLATPYDDEEFWEECAECGGDIFKGDHVLSVDDGLIHEDCFMDYAKGILQPGKVVAGKELVFVQREKTG